MVLSSIVIVALVSAAARAPSTFVSGERSADAVSAVQATAAAPPVPQADSRRLDGAFSIERGDGTTDAVADAAFELILWSDRPQVRLPVEVVAGRWQVELPSDRLRNIRSMSVARARHQGRDLLLVEPTGAIELASDSGIHVRTREPTPTRLRVVDAVTGMDLPGVQGVLAPPRSVAWHPDMLRIARGLNPEGRDLSSPVDLMGDFGLKPAMATLLVGADGYAWEPITLAVGAEAEQTIALSRAAAARIEIRFPQAEVAGTVVRLRRASEPEAGEMMLPVVDSEPMRVLGIRAGRYEVSAEAGPEDERVQVASQSLELEAGQESTAVLDIRSSDVPERAVVNGIVVVPSEWQVDRIDLDLVALDGETGSSRPVKVVSERIPDTAQGNRVFSFEAPSVPPGLVELAVDRPRFRVTFAVPPFGVEGACIDVPPPGEVVLRPVMRATGEPVSLEQLDWCALGRDGVPTGSHVPMRFDPGVKGFLLRAPLGTVSVMAPLGSGLEIPEPRVRVLRERIETNIVLVRSTEIEVELRADGTSIPAPAGWSVRVLEGGIDESPLLGYTRIDGQIRLRVLRGGRYRLEFDPLPGFEPPKSIELEVPASTRTKVAVALTRTRR